MTADQLSSQQRAVRRATRRGPARRACAAAVAAAVGTALLGGCATQAEALHDASSREAGMRSCVRPVAAAPAQEETAPAPSVEGYSQAAADIADTIGALGPLRQLSALDVQSSGGRASPLVELRLLRLRQRITDRLLQAMLDVSSVLAEVRCESERGAQLRDRLQKVEDRRTRRLGLGSALVGALTAILSGGLALASSGGSAGDAVALVGGTAEAGVGVAALLGSVSGELHSEHNLMREIWEGPARSSLFPRSVWRYLNRPLAGDAEGLTLRRIIVAQWRAGERLGPAGSQEERDRVALLFGTGGAYELDDLNAREAMLDLLEAGVASMNQELQLLLSELEEQSASRPAEP